MVLRRDFDFASSELATLVDSHRDGRTSTYKSSHHWLTTTTDVLNKFQRPASCQAHLEWSQSHKSTVLDLQVHYSRRHHLALPPGLLLPLPCLAVSPRHCLDARDVAGCSTSCQSPNKRRESRITLVTNLFNMDQLMQTFVPTSLLFGMTSRTKSRPTNPGDLRAFSTSDSSLRSVVETIPRSAPAVRSCALELAYRCQRSR